ncbi:MAG: hypothetical protein ABJF10_04945 [Chthoniobacter sp.]|uniref:hypothetical protein n=1 Tax=Chthoniobacter sp. TaxID=2510640 RepID=UPI0032A5B635
MFARTPLILTLVLSLLFVTQGRTVVLPVPVEMKQGGGCAAMQCASGCCANVACCKVTEQQKAPQSPVPVSADAQVQWAAIDPHAYTILFLPPVPRRPFVVSDEASTAHTLSPRAVSCIQLI